MLLVVFMSQIGLSDPLKYRFLNLHSYCFCDIARVKSSLESLCKIYLSYTLAFCCLPEEEKHDICFN